jgi:hypothetical protein
LGEAHDENAALSSLHLKVAPAMVEEKPNLTPTRFFVVFRFLRGCEPRTVPGTLGAAGAADGTGVTVGGGVV